MDGIVVAQQTVIVVLAITRDGDKVPLGLRLGSTENAVVCTELLQDLLARGLTLDGRVLWVIDGGKGLRKALGDVFGDAAVIQRCQLHKARNLDALVPQSRQAFFATTNCIENLIGTVRHVTRHIKRWRDGDMRRRWIGLGLLRAAERFRRIKRHGELDVLVTALGAAKAAERAA